MTNSELSGNEEWALPPSQKREGIDSKKWFKPAVISAAAAIVIGGGVVVAGVVKERSEWSECEERVIAHAKYPGGVTIDDIRKPKIMVPDPGEDEDPIRGYRGNVDFPNGFGVPVQLYYSCKIYDGGRMNVRVEEEIFL